jgi:hypothetical protein
MDVITVKQKKNIQYNIYLTFKILIFYINII